jgi:serralysin
MTQVLAGAGPESAMAVRPVAGLLEPGHADRDALLGDYKLGGGNAGEALRVTYSFATPTSTWSAAYPDPLLAVTTVALTPAQQAAAREAMAQWSAVANIDFVEVQETEASVGVIRFARSDYLGGAFTYLIDNGTPYGADIWFGTNFPGAAASLEPGSYGYMGFVHEIGHALGLKHPHEPPRVMSGREDWLGGSLMSYHTFPGQPIDEPLTAEVFPDGPMAFDVDAIRFLYGKRAFATGNDTYRFEPGERLFTTIVDDGGNDLLDWSNQAHPARIDLRIGAWSLLGEPFSWIDGPLSAAGSFPGSLRTAFGTVIERANGGGGDDRITGNGAANELRGGAGDDVLLGLAGDDLLLGQTGDDQLLGLEGRDELRGGAGADRMNGGSLVDILDGGDGADELFGGDGDDRLGGGRGDDIIHGGNGRDILAGGEGADRLGGGAGDDTLNGGPGDDVLSGGPGRDRLLLGADANSVDRITDFQPGIDLIVLRDGYTAGQFLAAARTIGGSTLFDLPDGHDVLVVGSAGAQPGWFGS